jgi:hypothetical protein
MGRAENRFMKTRKLNSTVAGLIAYILILLLLINCKKEYSYEGGTAEFTLLDPGAICSNPVITGDYIPGTTLNNHNMVQLTADVTVKGRYSFQTNTRGGILFSATGQFTDTGRQTITLIGSGRPDSAGSFPFTPDVPNGCTFTIPVSLAQTKQADYTLAGDPGLCSSPQISGNYTAGTTLTIGNTVLLRVNVNSPGEYQIHTDTVDGISFASSGIFTGAGLQTVTLQGSGNPVDPQIVPFTPVGNGSGCDFQLTVGSAGPLATYVIESGLNLCVGNFSGTFKAGQPLTTFDTYRLSVFVTVPGQFTISTATIDGISFYYTGVFASVGRQDVTIIGRGTPVDAGIFVFTPQIVGPHPIGGQACDFSLTID